jgi:hypothetical protein
VHARESSHSPAKWLTEFSAVHCKTRTSRQTQSCIWIGKNTAASVASPTRKGCGSRPLERTVRGLGGNAELDCDVRGSRCSITVTLYHRPRACGLASRKGNNDNAERRHEGNLRTSTLLFASNRLLWCIDKQKPPLAKRGFFLSRGQRTYHVWRPYQSFTSFAA